MFFTYSGAVNHYMIVEENSTALNANQISVKQQHMTDNQFYPIYQK